MWDARLGVGGTIIGRQSPIGLGRRKVAPQFDQAEMRARSLLGKTSGQLVQRGTGEGTGAGPSYPGPGSYNQLPKCLNGRPRLMKHPRSPVKGKRRNEVSPGRGSICQLHS
jgi:hypothetical protein